MVRMEKRWAVVGKRVGVLDLQPIDLNCVGPKMWNDSLQGQVAEFTLILEKDLRVRSQTYN